MASYRARTPSASYNQATDMAEPASLSRGYSASSHLNGDMSDFNSTSDGYQNDHRGRSEEHYDARNPDSAVFDGNGLQRSASQASRTSALNQGATPSRSGTLKKKGSVKRSGSLKRSGSRRSVRAGSIRGVPTDGPEHGYDREDSVFYTPVPTKGSPTEILAERFQLWRKFLKDLIAYFREIATSYEHRAKSLLKVSNVINNTNAPAALLGGDGLSDANRFLRDFHKQAIVEANKARDIEADVINQLSGLRGDLAQKIKEIKSLSGDFKNSVEKEKEHTRKCVALLEEALNIVDSDPSAVAGKGDPYVVKLGVERQVERQIDEENYLHKAYLNLENSGRELESIVVGEIQKAYNALASILKRDADDMYNTVEQLRSGPISMPRDREWSRFVSEDPHFVNPEIPLRRLEDIEYPGKHHPATLEVRAGMLERKSKYLKSYTPGWYVLSPTHIHEFKSADRIYTQPPVMSLYLPDQKLGSRSQPGSSSHKFVIKGRQTGSMHRGHTWVFRAETYETMLAWFDDIKSLTEKSGEERNAFVRRHASVRSTSAGSARSRASSDGGMEEDEADAIPYSANHSLANQAVRDDSSEIPSRPSPGGRFPSDLIVNRNLQAPLSPSSGSSEVNHDLTSAAGGLQDGVPPLHLDQSTHDQPVEHPQSTQQISQPQPAPQTQLDGQNARNTPQKTTSQPLDSQTPQPQTTYTKVPIPERRDSDYGDWVAPAAGGAASVALAKEMYAKKQMEQHEIAHQQELAKQQEFARQQEMTRQQDMARQEELAHQQLSAQHQELVHLKEAAQQQEINHQALLQNQEQHRAMEPPRTMAFLDTAPQSVPAPPAQQTAPNHIATADHAVQPVPAAPPVVAPIAVNQVQAPVESGLITPATTTRSFMTDSEPDTFVPFGESGKTINGGPVPVSLAEHAQNMAHPGVQRHNTDISVSDLHVPGEFPKTKGAAPVVGGSRVPLA